jgi:acetyl/propionyl-CoA carboxylase alpha subunit
VPADYDPLVAKVLAVGRSRAQAIKRLAAALDAIEVTGIQTTLPFDRWLVRDPGFRSAGLSTGFVDERWQPIAHDERRRALATAARVAAAHVAAAHEATPSVTAEALEATARLRTPGPADDGDVGLGRGWRTIGRVQGVDRWPR